MHFSIQKIAKFSLSVTSKPHAHHISRSAAYSPYMMQILFPGCEHQQSTTWRLHNVHPSLIFERKQAASEFFVVIRKIQQCGIVVMRCVVIIHVEMPAQTHEKKHTIDSRPHQYSSCISLGAHDAFPMIRVIKVGAVKYKISNWNSSITAFRIFSTTLSAKWSQF